MSLHVRFRRRFCTLFVGIIGSLLTLEGCGSKYPTTIQVQGKITYRGKPLEKGEVQFSPVNEEASSLRRIAAGEIDSQGIYSLSTFTKGDGVLPGEYAVTITLPKRKSGIDGGDVAVKPESFIPEKYTMPNTTPLKASIAVDASEVQQMDFEVKDQ
jgi:hypothetical protein